MSSGNEMRPSPVPTPTPSPNPCPDTTDVRLRMDLILKEVQANPALRRDLVSQPVKTLQSLGFDVWTSRYVANEWGLGPVADCGSGTCRLTDPCGWTVCGKTTNSCLPAEDDLRTQMDAILTRARTDPKFRAELVARPQETLAATGLDPWTANHAAETWGIGPRGDCGSGTCRLTDPCGWTVCGKTTNSCLGEEAGLRRQMDDLLAKAASDRGFRQSLIDRPEATLTAAGLDPWTARSVADAWGIGPPADCGHDTCRLTQACGWTVCGKTTNTCLEGSSVE